MDIMTFLQQFFAPIVAGICLFIGYLIKTADKKGVIKDYIPHIVACIGIVVAIWVYGEFTPVVLLTGLCSGVASTGLYEALKKFIYNNKALDEQ